MNTADVRPVITRAEQDRVVTALWFERSRLDAARRYRDMVLTYPRR